MAGNSDLASLLRHMGPRLRPETFVYCNFPDFELPTGITPLCTFREDEGLTAIVEREEAERARIPHVFEARLITLTVHSSLDAVGLLAAVASRLAEARIPCNVIAAYHHDHLLVPRHLASDAMRLLAALADADAHSSIPHP